MEVLSIRNNVEYPSNNRSEEWTYGLYPSTEDLREAVVEMTERLAEELRVAKTQHFPRGEVLLPMGMLRCVARDILAESESELCGVRGCALYLDFMSEDQQLTNNNASSRKLKNRNNNNNNETTATEATTLLNVVRFDKYTPPTFELHLTLRQATAGWNAFIPQFLKKYIRRGDVMIDSRYKLTKNKLYRSYVE